MAREGGPEALEAAMEFARACASGAVLGSWKGRRLDRDARDDVVQETLVRILRGITRTEKPVENLQDWVRGTVDLILREGWKQRERHRAESEPAPSTEPTSHEERPQDALVESERHAFVWECLDGLPPHYRRMLLFRYQEKLSNADIAVRLEKTEKAVERAIPRALKAMRDCLERKRMAP